MDRFGRFAGVPLLDGAVVLQARIAASPGAFGDFMEQPGGVLLLQRLVVGRAARPPFPAFEGGLHELVADPHGEVFVLVHDAAVSVAIIGAVVALLDQRPGLLFLLLFGVNELLDVPVPVAQRVHFGGPAGLAAGFDDVGHLVIHLQEGERPAGTPPAAEFLPAGTYGTEVRARAGAVLEEHRFAVRQPHDAFHVVLHRLDEAGAALRVLVLRARSLGLAGLAIVKPIAPRRILADFVLMIKTDIEPHGRIESPILIHAQPGQFIEKNLPFGLAEITVAHAPIGNGPAHAVNQLADRRFPFAGVLFPVKILRDHDFGGQDGPGLGHFDIFLFKNDLAAVIGDFGRAFLPLNLIERFDVGIAKNPFDGQAFGLSGPAQTGLGGGRGAGTAPGRRRGGR